MEDNKRVINLIAGILFLLRAVMAVVNMVSNIAMSGGLYMPLRTVVITVYGVIILAILGVCAFKQQKRSVVVNVLAIIYFALAVLSTVSSLAHVFNLQGILTLAVLIGLFVYTGKLNKDTMFESKEPATTVEKTHAQTKKQTSIYDQQLKDGILTQEEYDQIMENLK